MSNGKKCKMGNWKDVIEVWSKSIAFLLWHCWPASLGTLRVRIVDTEGKKHKTGNWKDVIKV